MDVADILGAIEIGDLAAVGHVRRSHISMSLARQGAGRGQGLGVIAIPDSKFWSCSENSELPASNIRSCVGLNSAGLTAVSDSRRGSCMLSGGE